MKKLLLIALSLIILPIIFSGCDYITGKALDETTPALGHGSRWIMGTTADGTGTAVLDRQTLQPIRDVTPEEASMIKMISSNSENPVIIDVRTPAEYAAGHVWDAINIDYNSPTFHEDIDKFNKNYTYIVYCGIGFRSDLARNIMEEMGFKSVVNVIGGFNAWLEAGIPVEQ